MIKRYYLVIKKYFSLGANNKKYLFHLFLSSTLRSLSMLTIPFLASKIVEYVTNGSFEMAILSVFVFLFCSLMYVFFHHYNYDSYANCATYIHNKLQELILNKVTKFDENFTKLDAANQYAHLQYLKSCQKDQREKFYKKKNDLTPNN